MPDTSFADKVRSWELLTTSSRPYLGEIPHIVDEHAKLEGIIADMKRLDAEEEALNARLRESFRQKLMVEQRGVELKGLLVAALQSHFGFKNNKLHEFGIKPRADHHPRPAEEPEAEGKKAAAPAAPPEQA